MKAFLRCAVVAALVALAATAFASPVPVDSSLTLVLVRHAEKRPHPAGGDSGLSVAGVARAQELVRVLEGTKLTGIYSSRFGRAVETARPVAAARGDSVRIYDPNRLDLLAARLWREARAGIVLVVGHSDTIGETIEQVSGLPFPHDEPAPYDRLWVVTFEPGHEPIVTRLSYGARVDSAKVVLH